MSIKVLFTLQADIGIIASLWMEALPWILTNVLQHAAGGDYSNGTGPSGIPTDGWAVTIKFQPTKSALYDYSAATEFVLEVPFSRVFHVGVWLHESS